MTVKCCRDCVYFEKRGHLQIPWCMGVLLIRIPKDAIDTFYCSEFTRRNSAKPVGQKEENVENTADNIPPIQRRFV